MAVASTVTATILIPNRIKMKKLVLAICLYLLSTRRAISARSQDCRKTSRACTDISSKGLRVGDFQCFLFGEVGDSRKQEQITAKSPQLYFFSAMRPYSSFCY